MRPEMWVYKTMNLLNQIEPYACFVIHSCIILGFVIAGIYHITNLFWFTALSLVFWMLFWDDLQVYTERKLSRQLEQ